MKPSDQFNYNPNEFWYGTASDVQIDKCMVTSS